jgi:hypothetical protein
MLLEEFQFCILRLITTFGFEYQTFSRLNSTVETDRAVRDSDLAYLKTEAQATTATSYMYRMFLYNAKLTSTHEPLTHKATKPLASWILAAVSRCCS